MSCARCKTSPVTVQNPHVFMPECNTTQQCSSCTRRPHVTVLTVRARTWGRLALARGVCAPLCGAAPCASASGSPPTCQPACLPGARDLRRESAACVQSLAGPGRVCLGDAGFSFPKWVLLLFSPTHRVSVLLRGRSEERWFVLFLRFEC